MSGATPATEVRRVRRLPRGSSLATLAFLGLLGWTPPPRVPESELPVVAPTEVAAGARGAETAAPVPLVEPPAEPLEAPVAPAPPSEPAPVELLRVRVERADPASMLIFELERAVPYTLERGDAGLELALDGARLPRPLTWLDLSGTPIRGLDVRRDGTLLRITLGLDPKLEVDVQSALLESDAGAVLTLALAAHATQGVEPEPQEPIAPAISLVVKRALDDGPADAYRDAMRLERAGDSAAALVRLRTLIVDHPEHRAGRARLVALLSDFGRTGEALRVLRAGPESPDAPSHAKLEARLLVEQRADTEAIMVLERALPDVIDDPEYHAFLAALVQRQGEHERAIALFQAALSEEPRHSGWWLGLAISEESCGRLDMALDSLSRALALGDLAPLPRHWAEERARALASKRERIEP